MGQIAPSLLSFTVLIGCRVPGLKKVFAEEHCIAMYFDVAQRVQLSFTLSMEFFFVLQGKALLTKKLHGKRFR